MSRPLPYELFAQAGERLPSSPHLTSWKEANSGVTRWLHEDNANLCNFFKECTNIHRNINMRPIGKIIRRSVIAAHQEKLYVHA